MVEDGDQGVARVGGFASRADGGGAHLGARVRVAHGPLRAAIAGPSGTPYHDNLFVFDFHLHQTYPNDPPSAHYTSFGLRANPNLYENGKVCLSLLHTWNGKGSETWDPARSNMLQVLVSIQGLVLVDKPYYNEAGYEKQAGSDEGERNAGQYAEQAFLASVKSMLGLLKKPPAALEALVRAWFAERGGKILRAIDAYMNGCPVGAYEEAEAEEDAAERAEEQSREEGGAERNGAKKKKAAPPGRNAVPPTAGFKLALGKLVPKLRAAFELNERAATRGGER